MDISSDSKLIVTCSADKNVKIWGLDFGDCHKSIFAHEESVMQVLFEKKSHYFWSVGKDSMVKYWDGDKVHLIDRCVKRYLLRCGLSLVREHTETRGSPWRSVGTGCEQLRQFCCDRLARQVHTSVGETRRSRKSFLV